MVGGSRDGGDATGNALAAEGPSSSTVFSTFPIKVEDTVLEEPNFLRQIGSCLTEFLQVWSYILPGIYGEK